jgi:hypothetical protein
MIKELDIFIIKRLSNIVHFSTTVAIRNQHIVKATLLLDELQISH